MAITWVQCWKCELCSHRWIKAHDSETPRLCAKCKKTGWHTIAPVSNEVSPKRLTQTEAITVGGFNDKFGDLPELEREPVNVQALRDICKGVVPSTVWSSHDQSLIGKPSTAIAEIPICGKTWWEDGNHYECLMDSAHRELKHGMRGMVRRLDD